MVAKRGNNRSVFEYMKGIGKLIRFHAPIGTYFLLFPCLFSILLVTPGSIYTPTYNIALKGMNIIPACDIYKYNIKMYDSYIDGFINSAKNIYICALNECSYNNNDINMDLTNKYNTDIHIYDIWLKSIYICILCIFGAFFMRSAGCIINDLWDKNYDKHVERTKNRPLACGYISINIAVSLIIILISLSAYIVLQFNSFCVILAMTSMIGVILYPTTKRYFFFPQLILGLTFNWGVLLGWASMTGNVYMNNCIKYEKIINFIFNKNIFFDIFNNIYINMGDYNYLYMWVNVYMGPYYLYCGCILWTIIYDTIYAHQDSDDDKILGLRSSALFLGMLGTKICCFFSSIFIVFLWFMAGLCVDMFWPYYICVGLCGLYLIKMSICTNLYIRSECGKTFVKNKYIGVLFVIGIASSKAYEFHYYNINV